MGKFPGTSSFKPIRLRGYERPLCEILGSCCQREQTIWTLVDQLSDKLYLCIHLEVPPVKLPHLTPEQEWKPTGGGNPLDTMERGRRRRRRKMSWFLYPTLSLGSQSSFQTPSFPHNRLCVRWH